MTFLRVQQKSSFIIKRCCSCCLSFWCFSWPTIYSEEQIFLPSGAVLFKHFTHKPFSNYARLTMRTYNYKIFNVVFIRCVRIWAIFFSSLLMRIRVEVHWYSFRYIVIYCTGSHKTQHASFTEHIISQN